MVTAIRPSLVSRKSLSSRWIAAGQEEQSHRRMKTHTHQNTPNQTPSSNHPHIFTDEETKAFIKSLPLTSFTLEKTDPKLVPNNSLPAGHRFFPDCQRETYARWIEWAHWTGHPKPDVWFVTLTFKTYVYERQALTILKKWFGHLRQAYQDRPAAHKTAGLPRGGQLRLTIASEWQIREVIHYHLLISGVGLSELSRKRWEVRWMNGDRNAGFCRVYDADKKAAPYLAKYIQKGNELTRGGYWRGLTTPNSVRCCQPNSDADPQSNRPLDPSVESRRGIQAAA